MKYCYHCGQAMGDDFVFCPVCGKTAPTPQSLYSSVLPPVYMAEPVQESTVGGRVMAGLSKGFGITALVFSIIASIFLFGSDDELTPILLLTALFAVPALLLGIFARKKGEQAMKGMVFGIIGCSVCTVLLLAILATL